MIMSLMDKFGYFEDVDDQFMFGESLMVAPALTPISNGKTFVTRKIVFPGQQNSWFNMRDKKRISENPILMEIDIHIDEIGLFREHGSIIVYEGDKNQKMQRSRSISVALMKSDGNENEENTNFDQIYFTDNGEPGSISGMSTHMTRKFSLTQEIGVFTFKNAPIYLHFYTGQSIIEKLNIVEFWGVEHPIHSVKINSKIGNFNLTGNYQLSNQVLTIDLKNLNFYTNTDFELVFELVENEDAVDCAPGETFPNPDMEENCVKRGCIFKENNRNSPKCYFPDGYLTYSMDKTVTDFPLKFDIIKNQNGEMVNHQLYSETVESLSFDVQEVNDRVVRILIKDRNSERFETPIEHEENFVEETTVNKKYEIRRMLYYNGVPRPHLQIIRKSDGRVIVDTGYVPLIYENNYQTVSQILFFQNYFL